MKEQGSARQPPLFFETGLSNAEQVQQYLYDTIQHLDTEYMYLVDDSLRSLGFWVGTAVRGKMTVSATPA